MANRLTDLTCDDLREGIRSMAGRAKEHAEALDLSKYGTTDTYAASKVADHCTVIRETLDYTESFTDQTRPTLFRLRYAYTRIEYRLEEVEHFIKQCP